MARHTESVCKICRNEGKKLFLKGDRCNSAKCSQTKRPYGSGQHGQNRKKLSEYAIHLREKQKCRFSYLVSEKQFSRYFKIAAGKTGVTGTVLLQLLESRFDNVVAKAGFTAGRKQSRQLIRHRHFLINDRIVDIPSYRLKAGDKISVKKGSEELIKSIIDALTPIEGVNWLEYDKTALKITVKSLPEREDIDPTVKEQLIVEYYSK
ncbi:MAG: 30S ribosomal protein S4 [Candidatus Melainabacteria bacterium GWA2_34_9]|nr:MAG: 30S ribosomal protein S4 [Candidatus Melainabacteria bacterium GWA2_34_9]